jgi:transcriptional regulator with XRE-family HTH domain
LRKRDGLTQSRAARAIGVELPTWGKWESDSVDRNPSPDSLDKIAKLFDVSVDDLFRVRCGQ